MNWLKRGDLLDRTFAIGIILKGLDGVLEVVGGVEGGQNSIRHDRRPSGDA
jgi:uncharacterized membrane protein